MTNANTNALINFASGPAMLPRTVVARLQAHLAQNSINALSMGHRSDAFLQILTDAKALIKKLAGVPDTHTILLVSGGARMQFSAIAMNFLHTQAGYHLTGYWSQKALIEAQKYGKALGNFSKDVDYVHICANETIDGIYTDPCTINHDNIICDATSCLLGIPLDISKLACVYAGCQKNLGIAGLSVVIVRTDFLQSAQAICPSVLDYQNLYTHNSLVNTPPVWAIFVLYQMLVWLDEIGMDIIYSQNQQKAMLLYNTLDSLPKYQNNVATDMRSVQNVPFDVEGGADKFLAFAQGRGLVGLAGHQSVGACRAGLYNAISLDDVQALCQTLHDFSHLG